MKFFESVFDLAKQLAIPFYGITFGHKKTNILLLSMVSLKRSGANKSIFQFVFTKLVSILFLRQKLCCCYLSLRT